MNPTIRDVARRAGTSVTTVSNVLNGNLSQMNRVTYLRVIKAIEELGYSRNVVARSLVRGKTETIGLMVPDVSSPFFPEFIKAVELAAVEKGYQVFLCDCEVNAFTEERHLRAMHSRQVDGIIVMASKSAYKLHKNSYLYMLITTGFPVVMVFDPFPGVKTYGVFIDDVRGAKLATEHLIRQGYQCIGHVAGSSDSRSAIDRLKGFQQALREHGIRVDKSAIENGQYEIDGSYRATEKILSRNPRVRAIFVASDLMAIGAMRAIKRRGMRIPEDVAIVGYDDIHLVSFLEPPLTTIRVPTAKMGKMAVDILHQLIIGRPPRIKTNVLQPELVIRESCGALLNKKIGIKH